MVTQPSQDSRSGVQVHSADFRGCSPTAVASSRLITITEPCGRAGRFDCDDGFDHSVAVNGSSGHQPRVAHLQLARSAIQLQFQNPLQQIAHHFVFTGGRFTKAPGALLPSAERHMLSGREIDLSHRSLFSVGTSCDLRNIHGQPVDLCFYGVWSRHGKRSSSMEVDATRLNSSKV